MEPVFNELLQLGFVVRDAEAAARLWLDEFGVGPWYFFKFDNPGGGGDKLAVCENFNVQLELIEPGDSEGVLGKWLSEHGPGLQHIAVGLGEDFEAVKARMEAKGGRLIMSVTDPNGMKNANIDMRETLGAVFEIFDRPAGYTPPPPNSTYPEDAVVSYLQ